MTSAGASDERRARQAARTVSALIVIASMAASIVWSVVPPRAIVVWPYDVCGVVSLVTWLALSLRPRAPMATSAALVALNVALALAAASMVDVQLTRAGISHESFNASKMAAFCLAIIAPMPFWLGYGLIAGCALVPVIVYYGLVPGHLRPYIPIPEPWSTLLFCGLAAGVLAHRIRQLQVERALIRAAEARDAAERRARLFLAIRDLTNTPLQIIELSTTLLQRQHPDASTLTRRIGYSLARLRKISEYLASYDGRTIVPDADVSFDAEQILRDERGDERGDERDAELHDS